MNPALDFVRAVFGLAFVLAARLSTAKQAPTVTAGFGTRRNVARALIPNAPVSPRNMPERSGPL